VELHFFNTDLPGMHIKYIQYDKHAETKEA
jgi:hypothetical protein